MIQRILRKAYEQKKLADINAYDEEDAVIGYITDVDDEYFTIKEVDKFGNLDGSTTYAIEQVKNISIDNWYLRALQLIINNRDLLKQDSRITIHKKGTELISQIEYLKENEIVTMLFFEEDHYESGIILDYDERFISLKDIGQDGCVLGITCYRLNEVTGLRYNGLGEQKTKMLYDAENRNPNKRPKQ